MNPIRSLGVMLSMGCLLVVCNASLGDITPSPLTGGETLSQFDQRPVKTRVAMVEEEVRLHVSKDFCETKAVFLMKNTSDTDETLQVGFPAFHSTDFITFTASVDGIKTVAVDAAGEDTGGEFPRTVRWKTWRTKFPAGKTRQIEVTYRHAIKPSGVASLVPNTTRSASESDQSKLREQFRCVIVDYVLVTGREWHGNIGKCRIEMTFEDMTPKNVLWWGQYADNKRVKEDRVVWEMKDFEPQSNLRIAVMPRATRNDLRELAEPILKKRGDDPTFVSDLADLDRADGREPDRIRHLSQLVRVWENRMAMWGPDSEDQTRLGQSVHVWLLTQELMKDCDKWADKQPAAEVAPVIRKMAQRLQTQAKAEKSNSPSVESRLPEIEATIQWCDKHSRP